MQNAPVCDVQRVIAASPFVMMEFDPVAVFVPETLAQWTWHGRAASKVEALQLDRAWRCHGVRYDPSTPEMMRVDLDELRREWLVLNREVVLRMVTASPHLVRWARDVMQGKQPAHLRRWLSTWLGKPDRDVVLAEVLDLLANAVRRIQRADRIKADQVVARWCASWAIPTGEGSADKSSGAMSADD